MEDLSPKVFQAICLKSLLPTAPGHVAKPTPLPAVGGADKVAHQSESFSAFQCAQLVDDALKQIDGLLEFVGSVFAESNRGGQFVKVDKRIVANQAEVKGIFLIGDLRPREDVKVFVDDSVAVGSLKSAFKVGEVFAAERVGLDALCVKILLVGKIRSSRVARSPPFFVPNGGLLKIRSKFFMDLPTSERVSPRMILPSSPCNMAFISARRWVSWTSSQSVKALVV